MPTVSSTLRKQREVPLPCGITLTIRRLRLLDQDQHFYGYALLGNFISLTLAGQPLTTAAVRAELAEVIAGFYAQERRQDKEHNIVLEWLQLYIPDLTADIMDDLQPEDCQAIVDVIMEDNPSPFDSGNPMLKVMQLRLLQPLLTESSEITSTASPAPDSTPPTPN